MVSSSRNSIQVRRLKLYFLIRLTIALRSDARIATNSSSFHESEMAPVWEPNESNCALCQKSFSLFVRKHHCRNWYVRFLLCFEFLFHFFPFLCSGACICEQCSKDKVRIPKFDEYSLFRVCNHCSKELKEQRTYGFQADLEK